MRKTIPTLTAALVLLTAACSGNAAPESAAAPAPVAAAAATGPAGMYDMIVTRGIEERTGTLEIVQSGAGFTGEGWLDGEADPAVIQSGSRTGNHVTLHAIVGGGNPVTFELDFEGNDFSGTITAGGDVLNVTGTRRP